MTPTVAQEFVATISSLESTSKGLGEARWSGDPAAINAAYHGLLENCRSLFKAEVCAIFLLQKPDEVVLEAHLGYEHPGGFPIKFSDLREKLRYHVGMTADSRYDGITGLVASTGREFSADSWEEIKRHPSHAGKPDGLRIWGADRPFRCVFAVPLTFAGRTIGVLKVENKRDPDHQHTTFSETDKLLLRTLAEYYSLKLGEARQRQRGNYDSVPSAIEHLAQRFDFYDMDRVIKRLPCHIEDALTQPIPGLPEGPFKGAVVVGMGGSALPADVVAAAFEKNLRAPLRVVRDYRLPASLARDYLIIASSFSGNTEETLAAVEQLPRDAGNIVCITVGGRLLTLAKQRNYPVIRMNVDKEPASFQPRSAVGYFVGYLTRILSSTGLMTDASRELGAVPRFLRSHDTSGDAEAIAKWLQDKIPVIYCDNVYERAVARIAKIKFNENAKRPAFFGALPEINHNEMIGFTTPLARFGLLYLNGDSHASQIRKRFKVMEQTFAEAALDHVEFREWIMPGVTRIEKIFAALAFAERCSYNLALLDGLDPTPVDMVEKYKNALVS